MYVYAYDNLLNLSSQRSVREATRLLLRLHSTSQKVSNNRPNGRTNCHFNTCQTTNDRGRRRCSTLIASGHL